MIPVNCFSSYTVSSTLPFISSYVYTIHHLMHFYLTSLIYAPLVPIFVSFNLFYPIITITATVEDIVTRGGSCLIPVFALGRAQELLLILDEYWQVIVLYCSELDWIELNWIELNWIELNWIELNWIELDWIELDWFGLDCSVAYCVVLYCIVLYCIVLYCIVLYCITFIIYRTLW